MSADKPRKGWSKASVARPIDADDYLRRVQQEDEFAATMRRVARPRGEVTNEQYQRIVEAENRLDVAKDRFRRVVVEVLAEGASFAEVSKATGLSTNTLQRWKREVR